MSQLTKMLKVEQEHLWMDLFWALRHAANGQWSVDAENKTKRILIIAHEVGMTPWERVQTTLLVSGVYNAIRLKLGMTAETFDLKGITIPKFSPGLYKSCERIKDLDLEEILNDFRLEEIE